MQSLSLDAFNAVPCKNKCGGTVDAVWHDEIKRWCYNEFDRGVCQECSRKESDRARLKLAIQRAGLTDEESKLTFDNFAANPENLQALESAKLLAMGNSSNLVFSGLSGRGKTHLALAIINARILGSVKFCPLTRWLMRIKSEITKQEAILENALSLDLLVLDDFGSQKITEWSLEFMDTLFDEWYRRRRKGLVLTTNFSLRKISENISDRIASRLAGMAEIYDLTGKDWRI